MKVTTNEESS